MPEEKTTLVRIGKKVHKKLRKYAFKKDKQMVDVVDKAVTKEMKRQVDK